MKALEPAIHRAERLGFDELDFVRLLEWVREQAPIIVHFSFRAVGGRLAADTHYRNQFETQASGGFLGHAKRISVESKLFGLSYDNATGFQKVKYGALNFANEPVGLENCRAPYGSDYMVLKNIRLRTTLSSADTFSTTTLATPDYYAHIFSGYTDSEFSAALKRHGEGIVLQAGAYKEAQFHGAVCLREHVAKIVLHADTRKHDSSVLKRLSAACGGCPVLWMDSPQDMEAARQVPKSLRERSYES